MVPVPLVEPPTQPGVPMTLDKYFEVYRDLFIHPGWKQFIEETQESYDSIDLDSAKDYEAFLIARTIRRQLKAILAFEEGIKNHEARYEDEKNLEVYDDSI